MEFLCTPYYGKPRPFEEKERTEFNQLNSKLAEHRVYGDPALTPDEWIRYGELSGIEEAWSRSQPKEDLDKDPNLAFLSQLHDVYSKGEINEGNVQMWKYLSDSLS